MLFLSLSVNAYAGTIRIEGILDEPLADNYGIPKELFEISNNSKICPSNQCKLIPPPGPSLHPSGMFLGLNEEGNIMMLIGFFRLQDDITNGHFTPKKAKIGGRCRPLFYVHL
jgi:hypothetical protein